MRPARETERPTMGAAGFTLLEALVGLFLLGVVVLGAAPMFVFAIQSGTVGADFGTTGAIAVERLEGFRAAPYLTLAAGGDLDSNVTGYFDASDPEHLVRWRIDSVVTPRRSYVIRVRVISQRETAGLPKEVVLTMLRGR